MADLLREAAEAAAAAATAAAAAAHGNIPPRARAQNIQAQNIQFQDEDSFGGHNLRATIRDTNTRTLRTRLGGTAPEAVPRPRSTLASGGANTRRILNIPDSAAPPPDPPQQSINEEYGDGDDLYDDDDDSGSGDGQLIPQPPRTATPTGFQPARTTPPTVPQPFVYTHIRSTSGLSLAAAKLAHEQGLNTGQILHWQASIGGETTRAKEFRQEVTLTQELDLIAFAFMPPGSAYIQILHSPSTFAVRGGDEDMRGKDYGFLGDRTDTILSPPAVLIEDKVWKWVTKKINRDITPLEFFYAVPGNTRKFWQPPNREREESISIPRILLLPPPFLAYCIDKPRTPFELHQFATKYATSATAEISINDLSLVVDWCITAAHQDSSSTTTSTLAHTFPPAPMHNDIFVRWLNKVLTTTLGTPQLQQGEQQPPPEQPGPRHEAPSPTLEQPPTEQPTPAEAQELPVQDIAGPTHLQQTLLQPIQQPQAYTAAPAPIAHGAAGGPQPQPHAIPPLAQPPLPASATQQAYGMPPLPPGFPPTYGMPMPPLQHGLPPAPNDMWAQIAANLTQGIATVAAQMQPTQGVRQDGSTLYDDGGKTYDSFHLAVLRGFAHTHELHKLPPIWTLFQYTKHMDTHRDNIKRKMIAWAGLLEPPLKRDHVQIERGLYLHKTTMQDILALRFNPGGSSAELSTVTQGLSILACRAVSQDTRSAMRRREIAEPRAQKRSVAEMEQELATTGEPNLYPDNFNELHVCLGTYCALLHTLFGSRCVFYKHCYRLWEAMQSDGVYDQRHLFSPLFCRQIVWAIIADGRAYFAQRLTLDDFAGIHPDDIAYPRSNLIEIETNVRRLTPLIRFSFPAVWTAMLEGTTPNHAPGLGVPVGQQQIPAVVSGTSQQASVVSGITTGSRTTRNQGTRPRVQIRATDINPTLKAAMEPYINKFQSIRLNQMLTKLNITVDDLPTLPATVSGTTGVCYNYVLGMCTHEGCNHKDGHVKAEHVTDEFATDLLTRLRPAISDFMANGLPPRPRGRRRRRNE